MVPLALPNRSTPPLPAAMEERLHALSASVAIAAEPSPSATAPAATACATTVGTGQPPLSPLMRHLLLRDITNGDQAEEDHMSLQRLTTEDARRAVPRQRLSLPAPTTELPFTFARLPALEP